MSETVSPRKGMFFFSEGSVGGKLQIVMVTFCSAVRKSAVVPSKDVDILEVILRSSA